MDSAALMGIGALAATIVIGGLALLIGQRTLHWGIRGALAAEEENALQSTMVSAEHERNAAAVAVEVTKSWVLTREGNDRTVFGVRIVLWNKSPVPDVLTAAAIGFQGSTYKTGDGNLLAYRDEGARRPYAQLPIGVKQSEPLSLWLEFKVPGHVGTKGDKLPATLEPAFGNAPTEPIDFIVDVGM